MALLNNVSEMTDFFIDSKVKPGDVVLDLTMGNGNDTLYLSGKVGQKGKVYAFDIQKEALKNTKALLKEKALYDNTVLILDSHINLLEYVKEKVSFAVYNLGYLPKGDKSITTKKEDTLLSIKRTLSVLDYDGTVCICAYVGHEGGMEEYKGIVDYCKELDKKSFNIVNINHLNRRETSPVMILIEKIR
ncbi:class I SAM-dependent methyltransferase [Anaerofustis sp.]|uniref:class I SAM-dependent methyltransferase n=1 Tax=Anaerofustis sp. TaxID=1872517 RepID=UPI0025BB9997|nr:class I SAM-dependent methyltransferase [Anaerofustis sp.]